MIDRSTVRKLAPDQREIRAKQAALSYALRRAYEAYAEDEIPKELFEILKAADRAADEVAYDSE